METEDDERLDLQTRKLDGMNVSDFLDIFVFGRHFFIKRDGYEYIYELWYEDDEKLTRDDILSQVKYLRSSKVHWSFCKDDLN